MNEEVLRPVARSLLRTYQVRSSRSKDLAEALSRGTACSWSDEEALCNEGEDSDNMQVILKGKIRVARKDVNGEMRELAILDAPTMVGQMGLVDGSARSATCFADGSVGAITINRETFSALLNETSSAGAAFRHLLLSSMAMQLSTANQKIRDLIADMEKEKKKEEKFEPSKTIPKNTTLNAKPKESSTDRLMKIAGVLDGWNIDSEGIDDVEFYEDEDMRRTREAKEKRRY